jgi:chromosome segregation ATPase
VTLSDCANQKDELQQKIDESTDKIGNKRKQMESLREELRVLGEEELQLKKKRDTSYAKCAEIKKRLKSSREAQQQIATFTSKTNSSSNSLP